MSPMAQRFEEIFRKQRPVSSEEFWAQVEAFKDKPEETRTSLDNCAASENGPKREESLTVARAISC